MHLKSSLAAWAVLACLAGGSASAQPAGEALARNKNCMACHQVDSKRVGPPLRSISERYAGQSEAAAYLAGKIRGGGRGAWGAVPMPVQPQVSDADAHALAEWILSLPAKP